MKTPGLLWNRKQKLKNTINNDINRGRGSKNTKSKRYELKKTLKQQHLRTISKLIMLNNKQEFEVQKHKTEKSKLTFGTVSSNVFPFESQNLLSDMCLVWFENMKCPCVWTMCELAFEPFLCKAVADFPMISR